MPPKFITVQSENRTVELNYSPTHVKYTIPLLGEQKTLGLIQTIDMKNGKLEVIFMRKYNADVDTQLSKKDLVIEQKNTTLTWD
jgi:hypothetical protein